MVRSWLMLLLISVPSQSLGPKGDSAAPATPSKREQLMEIHSKDAAAYTIYRDASRKEMVELQREPVFNWTNVLGAGDEYGAVFVWTCRGRVEVVTR
jgi:hypothetical protein